MERSTGSVSSSDYEYSEGERKSDYEISNDEIQKLVEKSVEVKEEAYAPYSTFKVGAALLTDKGEIFTGCNVENSAYPLCTCAERCVVVKAVSEGQRSFKAIAVVTNNEKAFAAPCGNCRQVMSEFAEKSNYWVIMSKPDGSYLLKTVDKLLPYSFKSEDLRNGQQKS